AKRLDLAGDLVADDAGQAGRVGIEPDASERVGEVDPRRPDRDPHLSRAHRRIGALLRLEHLGWPVAGDHDGAHADDPTPGCARTLVSLDVWKVTPGVQTLQLLRLPRMPERSSACIPRIQFCTSPPCSVASATR